MCSSRHNWLWAGNLNDHLMNMSIFTLIMYKILYELWKSQGIWLLPHFGFANHLVLIACPGRSGLVGESHHFRPIYYQVSILIVELLIPAHFEMRIYKNNTMLTHLLHYMDVPSGVSLN